ncbi:MAG: hypothetical protein A2Z02_02450 [Chloroflexi bacterium RBG_16_48_7]|nr:MAG: hypothetical protein A2Z02_02450 [Chloroflexi bacterium RBG_16_48_7]
MKVLAPLDNVAEIDELLKAGAGEFYCSVLSEAWTQKYSIAAISRRPAKICNFKSFDELKVCTGIAHKAGVPVCLAINEHYYTEDQLPQLMDYVYEAIDAGIDSFMIADVGLLLLFRERNISKKRYISTGGTVFNSESAMFYKELGASGITLPRHLTIDEIRKTVTNISGLETCVFILNSRCPNVDGFCTFMHVQSADPSYKNACSLPYSVELLNQRKVGDTDLEREEVEQKNITACVRQQAWQRYHMDDYPCGLCALFEFHQMGIDAIKIVGRGNPAARKVKDLRVIHELLAILEEAKITKEEFRARARSLYRDNYQRECRTIMCYYPEVMTVPESASK